MNAPTIVIVIALLATAAALVTGLASMANGGEFDKRYSHQLMFLRVGLQGVTLLLLIVALMLG